MADPTLVVAPLEWRDACFSLPATRALGAVAEVTVLCPPEQEPFWKAAACGEVIAAEGSPRALAAAIPDLPRALLWEDGPGAKACAKAGIATRIGLPGAGLAKRLTDPLERKLDPGPPAHAVRRFLDTAALLGAEPHDPRWFEPLPVERDMGSTLLAPDSDYGDHFEWSDLRWTEIFEHLEPDPERVKLASGPIASRLGERLGLEVLVFDRPVDVGRFQFLIGADASLPHIAGAYGTTCAVLYGPDDPARIRPLGKRHTAIRRKVECSPCFAEDCPLDLRCQHELTVPHVEAALTRFLGL